MFNRLLNLVGLINIQLLFAFGFQAQAKDLPQLNAHHRKVRDDGSFLSNSGGPVASSGRDGDADTPPENLAPNCADLLALKCFWFEHRKQVLGDVFFNTKEIKNSVMQPRTDNCATALECKLICEQIGCNYFVFDTDEKNAKFYDINEKIIEEENYILSPTMDSYTVYCKSREAIDPGCPDCDLRQLFVRFIKKYNKKYASDEEFESRFKTFKESINIISDFNKLRKPDDAGFGITQFTDASYDEFLSSFTGSLPSMNFDKKSLIEHPERIEISTKCPKHDWANLGVIPPVRDQGHCGCCYAFSSADLLSAQWHIDRKLWNQTATLSPQQIVDCFGDPAAFGCGGGRPVKVLNNLTAPGLTSESCYPYKGAKEKCRQFIQCPNDTTTYQTKWSTILSVNGIAEKRLMASYLNHGPLVVIVDASKAWQFYNGTGIIRGRSCSTKVNHAVLMTGYDYTGPVPYYIIKNSWGKTYGVDGYVRLQAGKNSCGVAQSITLTCTTNCEKFSSSVDPLCKPNSVGCVQSQDLPEFCKKETTSVATTTPVPTTTTTAPTTTTPVVTTTAAVPTTSQSTTKKPNTAAMPTAKPPTTTTINNIPNPYGG